MEDEEYDKKLERIKKDLKESDGFVIMIKNNDEYSLASSGLEATEAAGLIGIGKQMIYKDILESRTYESTATGGE